MAKKKKAKHKKKVYRRQAVAPVSAASTPPVAASAGAPAVPTTAPPVPIKAAAMVQAVRSDAPAARWSYVGGDVRRIGILAAGCVVAELVLWYLFTYTGLGLAVYGLIK